MNATVRLAEARDLPAVLAIFNDAILHTTASYHYAPVTLDERRSWWEAKVAKGLPLFVADDAEEGVVGWSTYGPFRAWEGYRFSVENSVYVAPHCRGKGAGTLLLDAVVTHAREGGYHAMVAAIDADNAVSMRLHARFGFVKVAHFHQIGVKFDRWLDLVFMELLLGGESALPGGS